MARTALLNVMVQAVLKAGRGLTRDFGEVENLQVSLKGPGDFVSAADRRADEVLIAELRKARPGYRLPHRGERRHRRQRRQPPLDHRPARRHHQLPARHSALRHLAGAGARGPARRRRRSTTRSSTSSTSPRRAAAPSSTTAACGSRARRNLADCVIATGLPRHRPAAATTRHPRDQPDDAAGRRPAPHRARPPSTSPGSPPAASTATGSTDCQPVGHRGRHRARRARPAASSPTPRARRRDVRHRLGRRRQRGDPHAPCSTISSAAPRAG